MIADRHPAPNTTNPDTRHLVDPELLELLDQLPAADLTAETLALARTAMAGMATNPGAPSSEVTVTEHAVPLPYGRLRLLTYRPNALQQNLPALLHLHGGGFVLGSIDQYAPMHRMRATNLGCVVVAVEYRLAPETPYPGAIEDAYAALAWTHQNATTLGIDRTRVAIAGESAGGGLAAALALLARDRGGPAICLQMLVYPMLDDRTGTPEQPTPNPYAGQFIWTAASNQFGWKAMLGQTQTISPYCAPARAHNLANLPPAFVAVGALDLFVDESIDYAARLIRAGVPTTLHVYPGAYHGFDANGKAKVTRQFQRHYTRTVKSWGGVPPPQTPVEIS